jgi:DNA-directed RNA polymerase subunit RPC12/RpoP
MNEFKFSCPHCGQHIQCDALWSGREINCPACQQPLVVPSPSPPVPEVRAATGPPIKQEPSGKRVKYRRYEDVPWYRQSTLNHVFALGGLLCFPPLVWWVVAMCLSGDIYKNSRDKDGNLKTWGLFSKVFSVFLVVCQILAIVFYVIMSFAAMAG